MQHHGPRLSDHFFTRREFLSRCGIGMGGLALSSMLPDAAQASASSTLSVKGPHFTPRAKRVIHIFLNGGPSHVDTFDPKPSLQKYAGKLLPMSNLRTERKTGAAFPSPYKFKRHGQSGTEVSEIFPHTAKCVDDIAVIRSMHADVPNHEPSLMLMNSGDNPLARPSLGSWLTYGLGTENRNLPGFIAMCPGGHPVKGPDNWRSAFLPGIYEGVYVDTAHSKVEQLIKNIRNPRLGLADQRRQLDLLQALNRRHLDQRGHDPQLEARIQSYEQAYRMQMEATDAFDVEREPESTRERYGKTTQSRQLLMARRLVERGVRFVQVWHGKWQPWDNHDAIEKNHRKLAAECSQGIAALIGDLKERGLFEDTLIVIGGEFGRTPTVEITNAGKSKLGRDHNSAGFSMVLAGGGVKGGTVHGATDEFGFQAVENPVHVHDLHATILHLMGFDHERLTYRYASRDFRLTDVHGRVVRDIIA